MRRTARRGERRVSGERKRGRPTGSSSRFLHKFPRSANLSTGHTKDDIEERGTRVEVRHLPVPSRVTTVEPLLIVPGQKDKQRNVVYFSSYLNPLRFHYKNITPKLTKVPGNQLDKSRFLYLLPGFYHSRLTNQLLN